MARGRANRLMGGGRTVLFDNFADADGTDPLEHAPDSGFVWFYPDQGANPGGIVTGNQITMNDAPSVGLTAILLASSKLRRRNAAIEADLTRVGAGQTASAIFELVFRAHRSRSNQRPMLTARYDLTSTITRWELVKNNLTVVVTSATQALTLNQTYRMRAECRGGVMLLWVDGALTYKVDMPETIRGYLVGIRLQSGLGISGNPLRLDSWMAVR